VRFVPRTTSPALLYTATCSHFLIGGRVVVGCRAAKRCEPRGGSRLVATPSTPGRPNPTNGSINPNKTVEPTDGPVPVVLAVRSGWATSLSPKGFRPGEQGRAGQAERRRNSLVRVLLFLDVDGPLGGQRSLVRFAPGRTAGRKDPLPGRRACADRPHGGGERRHHRFPSPSPRGLLRLVHAGLPPVRCFAAYGPWSAQRVASPARRKTVSEFLARIGR
jgi:hypothetical protein